MKIRLGKWFVNIKVGQMLGLCFVHFGINLWTHHERYHGWIYSGLVRHDTFKLNLYRGYGPCFGWTYKPTDDNPLHYTGARRSSYLNDHGDVQS